MYTVQCGYNYIISASVYTELSRRAKPVSEPLPKTLQNSGESYKTPRKWADSHIRHPKKTQSLIRLPEVNPFGEPLPVSSNFLQTSFRGHPTAPLANCSPNLFLDEYTCMCAASSLCGSPGFSVAHRLGGKSCRLAANSESHRTRNTMAKQRSTKTSKTRRCITQSRTTRYVQDMHCVTPESVDEPLYQVRYTGMWQLCAWQTQYWNTVGPLNSVL